MNEVSTDTAALLLDAIEQRGGDAEALWAGLPVTRALLHTPGRRIDWELWVEMMARVAARYPGQVSAVQVMLVDEPLDGRHGRPVHVQRVVGVGAVRAHAAGTPCI